MPAKQGRHGKRGLHREIGEEYPTIDLAALVRFAVYVEENRTSPVPLSFRTFMGEDHSHRTMVQTVDAIEGRAERLLMVRAILDERNRSTRQYTDDYAVAKAPGTRTRREKGEVTRYGDAWADLGKYVGELIEFMAEAGNDPAYIRDFLQEQHRAMNGKRNELQQLKRRS